MKIIGSHYSGDCSWIPQETDDYFIFDRTECGLDPKKVRKVPNIGNADYDRLTYLIENYEALPDVFLLIKTNLFKFITIPEFQQVKNNTFFTPLLTYTHKTYMPICRYRNGIYEEINNSWYVPAFTTCFPTYNDWAREFGFPTPEYLSFAPGGNYILTRDTVHKHPKSLYSKLRDSLSYCQLPAEAQFCERTYYTLWNTPK
jgi:hypothetical protein